MNIVHNHILTITAQIYNHAVIYEAQHMPINNSNSTHSLASSISLGSYGNAYRRYEVKRMYQTHIYTLDDAHKFLGNEENSIRLEKRKSIINVQYTRLYNRILFVGRHVGNVVSP